METITPSKVGLSRKRLDRITATMRAHIDQREVAGTITLVARRGQVAHYEVQGLRDVEAGLPMRDDTLFRIYSMTKPVTSLAAMMLFEEGRLRLIDPIAKFIPAFKESRVFIKPDVKGPQLARLQRPITVRDLLTHTAGLSYGFHYDSPIEEMYRTSDLLRPESSLAEMVDEVAKIPLLFQPGTRWRYSVATDVLGRLVEVVSGQALDAFLTERIFEPLGMTDTAFYVSAERLERLAQLYEPAPAGGLKVMFPDISRRFVEPTRNFMGGGGLVSTMTDYLRFSQMLLNGGVLERTRLVSRKTIELMTTNHIPPECMPISMGGAVLGGYGFGLGFRVLLDPAQALTLGSVGEYGWGGLASTYFFVDPLEQMIGILLTQLVPQETHLIRYDFRNLAYQAIVD